MTERFDTYMTGEPLDVQALMLVQLDRAAYIASYLKERLDPTEPTARIAVPLRALDVTSPRIMAGHDTLTLAHRIMASRYGDLRRAGLGQPALDVIRRHFPATPDTHRHSR